jgi:tRNA threonylcarbamoyladenosine biosynthesis protein TsaE
MADKHIQITTHSVAETQSVGQILGATLKQASIIALNGDLGSGKTAFVQGFAKGLEVSEKYYITSPTFTLINEYPGRQRLIHIDLYRIEYISELEEIGLDEVLYQDAVIAIEWADKLPDGTLPNHLAFQFKIISDESRQIDIFAYGHPESNLLKTVEKRVKTKLKGESRNKKWL